MSASASYLGAGTVQQVNGAALRQDAGQSATHASNPRTRSSFPVISISPSSQRWAQFSSSSSARSDLNFLTDASQPSTSYQPPRVIARSPRNAQRMGLSHAPRRTKAAPSISRETAKLLENTLKLTSLGVSSAPTQPSLAPKVTLSDRSWPDSKVVFDQEPFQRRRKELAISKIRTGDKASDNVVGVRAGLGTEVGTTTPRALGGNGRDLVHSATASTAGTTTISSPSSSIDPLPVVTTPASSLITEGDLAGPADPSTPPLARRSAAWTKPRSWADLASRMGPSALGGGNSAFSEAVNGTASSERSPTMSPSSTASPFRHSKPNGAERQQGKKLTNGTGSALSLASVIGQAETQFHAPLTYPRGMINKGNLCFANAILQVLVYCAPFYNLFRLLGENVPHDFHNSAPLMEAVIHFLAEFHVISEELQRNFMESPSMAVDALRDLQSASEPFVPEPLYDAMKLNKRFDTMRRGHQEDAEEFLGFFLDTLHEELQSTIQKSEARMQRAQGLSESVTLTTEDEEAEAREVNRPMSPSEGDGWLEVGQKGRTSFTRTTSTSHSPITRIFGGKLRSVLRTPGSKDSVTLEPYQPLQLDIQPAHVTTIEEALENLTRPETISGVLSSTKTLVDATKQVFIETLPPILVVHLKRFYYDDIGGVQKSSKVLGYGPTLEFAENVISPARRAEAQRRYKLFGVVYHHGRFASGGHYTVDVLRQDRSEWLHIDDTTWNPVASPSAKSANAGNSNSAVGTVPSSPKVTAGQPSLKSSVQNDGGSAYLLFYAREDAMDASTATNGKATLANGLLPPISVRKLAEAANAGPGPVVPGAPPTAQRRAGNGEQVKHQTPASPKQRRNRV